MDDVIMVHLPKFFGRVFCIPKHDDAPPLNGGVERSLAGRRQKGHPFFPNKGIAPFLNPATRDRAGLKQS
jgi:hypothetical protein